MSGMRDRRIAARWPVFRVGSIHGRRDRNDEVIRLVWHYLVTTARMKPHGSRAF